MLDLLFIMHVISKCRFLLIISRARIMYYIFTVNVTVMFTHATYINFIQNCVHGPFSQKGTNNGKDMAINF